MEAEQVTDQIAEGKDDLAQAESEKARSTAALKAFHVAFIAGMHETHPAAAMFPMLSELDKETMAASIKALGLQHPILVDEDGRIVDGRNRAAALLSLGMDRANHANICVVLRQIDETPAAYQARLRDLIIAENIERRHLTTSQRAAIAAELATMTKADASALGKLAQGKSVKDKNSFDTSEPPKLSIEQAAAALNVSPAAVKQAKAVAVADRAAFAAIKAGETTVGAAKAKLTESKPTPPQPSYKPDAELFPNETASIIVVSKPSPPVEHEVGRIIHLPQKTDAELAADLILGIFDRSKAKSVDILKAIVAARPVIGTLLKQDFGK